MDSPPPEPAEAAEHAPAPLQAATPPPAETAAQPAPLAIPAPAAPPDLELASTNPHSSRAAVALDLYRSANRRMIFGPLCATGAGLTGLGAMAVWGNTRVGSAAVAVSAEGFAISGFALLASGVQMQRRSQEAFGYEPVANPYFGAGLALGGGALVLGALAPGALATESRP